MDDAQIRPPPKLRAGFVLVGVIMFALWGASLIPAIENWDNPNEDGFSFLPVFWATLTCLPLGFVLIAGGIIGRGKAAARARTGLFVSAGLLALITGLEVLRRISELAGD
jgi:hypothetical protein